MQQKEKDLKKLVNVKKVIKEVKIGHFALYSKNADTNLVFTSHFILNLNPEQFWEVRCGLLVKELGKWFYTCKDGLTESKEMSDKEIELYYNNINKVDLELMERTELSLGEIAIYVWKGKYIGLKHSQIEMIHGGVPTFKKTAGSDIIIADDVHVFTPVKELECEYLAELMF
ncbi:MAG: hypothetical protein H6Q73_3799 [Firmicutes bacterium]|nr:hypothetical protein [Bacillota bacterium]